MLKKLFSASSLLASGLPAFQRQESVFTILDLFLLALLLLFHALFSTYWGNPSRALVIVLGIGFFLKPLELVWLQSLRELPNQKSLMLFTSLSIGFDLSLALILSILSNTDDSPYYVLILVPILKASFRFGAAALTGVIALSSAFIFIPVWHYFAHHPPVEVLEYLEAAISSLIFAIAGLFVWLLVRDVREKEADQADHWGELYQARETLLQDEKLAALQRWSGAIAREIHNPVLKISSSIARAKRLAEPERDNVCQVASEEASRLVTLTSRFLAYADLRPPKLEPISVSDIAVSVAEACRDCANEKNVLLKVETLDTPLTDADHGQLQQALVNMITNAVEASASGSVVTVKAYSRDHMVCVDIENSGNPIPDSERLKVFEPFFTTKSSGAGLGLPIARNIARAHGGDLTLNVNESRRICFSLSLPVSAYRQQMLLVHKRSTL